MSEDEEAAVDQVDEDGQHHGAPHPPAPEEAAAGLGRDGEQEADRGQPGARVGHELGEAPDEHVLAEQQVPGDIDRRRRDDGEHAEPRESEPEGVADAPDAEDRAPGHRVAVE